MAHITEKEVLHLAHLARLNVEPAEAEQLAKEIEPVLAYASFLKEIAARCTLPKDVVDCSANVMRDDEVVRFDSELILAQAPQREDSYFVVPRIIKRG
ncbi:MAG: Aspartyl/glutamyl-tRNA(Asn/Gln) amidotransferase subunit C [candidate division TM6 bacterium GW2011_GWF2_43_87]|nr:MAG: Aspartyl/glutamyl-tRNA(Asn/Gln) amidotransferase subunit C [candidate division TM6 bacterium GW2011_GWF2_43_87]